MGEKRQKKQNKVEVLLFQARAFHLLSQYACPTQGENVSRESCMSIRIERLQNPVRLLYASVKSHKALACLSALKYSCTL